MGRLILAAFGGLALWLGILFGSLPTSKFLQIIYLFGFVTVGMFSILIALKEVGTYERS